jgi:glycosyltransferase involved in cell wall biosynthesis
MPRRVLHLLSQRPSRTGSGITLEALVAHAHDAGWEQQAVVGTPADDPHPPVASLAPAQVHPLRFGEAPLDFSVPGMSDVMPYPSSRFSALSEAQLERYRQGWRDHLQSVVARFTPDVIHSHHLWLMSSVVKDVAPNVPLVNHCHATGLRQRRLCPAVGEQIAERLARNDAFVVLHDGQRDELCSWLGVDPARVRVVGSGYRSELFHAGDRTTGGARLLYAGKYAHAKGLPQLLDACDALAADWPELELRIAGSGAGDEADALRQRMASMAPRVTMLGQLDQAALAAEMRAARAFVLPSFYEGIPLVVVEALASGARVVCTALPGVVAELAPALGDALALVEPPPMRSVDQPDAGELPAFVERLSHAIATALRAAPLAPDDLAARVAPFRWKAVFDRVEALWLDLAPS